MKKVKIIPEKSQSLYKHINILLKSKVENISQEEA